VAEFGCSHLHNRTTRLGRPIFIASLGVLLLLPLPTALFDPHVRAVGPVLGISVVAGVVGLSGLVAQASLPARWRWLRPILDADHVLRWHRRLAAAVAVAVVVHVVALAVHDPEGFLHLIGPSAPIRAKLASLATVALLLLSVLSLWRKQLNLRYGLWRATM